MDGVKFDREYMYRHLAYLKDPFTRSMWDRLDAEKLKRKEGEENLKALAADMLDRGYDWSEAPSVPMTMSREEFRFWLDATFGQRYGRGQDG